MTEKKPYSAPQLVRVELNHEQAILSVCNLTPMNATAGTTNTCKSNGCKQSANGGDNVGRAS